MPETTDYLFLGLGAVVTITALFLGSLTLRYRNLRRDAAALEEIMRGD